MITNNKNYSEKTITILGSTGSIGGNTLDVIENCEETYKIASLTANGNYELLAQQAIKYKPEKVVIGDKSKYTDLKNLLSGTNIEVLAGDEAVVAVAAEKTDIVMSAIVGSAGLKPTMAAIEAGNKVALANKECLVCAGQIMMDAVKKYGGSLIPVDSEHNAIMQVLDYNRPENIDKIILTASGGPFRSLPLSEFDKITLKDALNHPNWDMGNKITIDSATMMNKGLELIEAYYLFPVEEKQIEIIVHPESIIHSMVEYKDGSVLAQLGTPDMRTPISVALAWPERYKLTNEKLDLLKIRSLNFENVDLEKFPCLSLARQALQRGGAYPAILNSANEVAVSRFIKGEIKFTDIPKIVEKTIEAANLPSPENIDDVLNIIRESVVSIAA